ncbi:hypothetical protein PVAND_005219 [Polypedilum vanderplanki]|nr:hypothetical protein PVAND_005219 [Polypedilum vanderplanki]
MSAEVPRTGFALGQSKKFLDNENQSGCEVKKIKIKSKKGEVYLYPGDEFIIINTSYTLVKDTVTVPNNSTSYELEYDLDIPKDIQFSELIYSQTIKNAHKITTKAFLKRKYKESLEKGNSLPKLTSIDTEYIQKFIEKRFKKPSMFVTD